MPRDSLRTTSMLGVASATLAYAIVTIAAPPAAAQSPGGDYLDVNHCGDALDLNPSSNADNGACQLWRFVPVGDGWSRLQLEHDDRYLDANHCGDTVDLNAGSDYEGGSCQLWRFVAARDGWSRLQLKHNGAFLAAKNCGPELTLEPQSDAPGAACQLWRLVPTDAPWARLQIKFGGGAGAPVASAPPAGEPDVYLWNGATYEWYEDGWNGPGFYIVGFAFRAGEGWGGGEGWRGWRHHRHLGGLPPHPPHIAVPHPVGFHRHPGGPLPHLGALHPHPGPFHPLVVHRASGVHVTHFVRAVHPGGGRHVVGPPAPKRRP
ncbi:MAG: RICIN domain-containing protein [Roseiarcus sp.]